MFLFLSFSLLTPFPPYQRRMDKRRDPVLMNLIIYLQSGNIPSSNDHFKYSSKNAAISFTVKIPIQKELQNAISFISDPQNTQNRCQIDKYIQPKKEFRQIDSF